MTYINWNIEKMIVYVNMFFSNINLYFSPKYGFYKMFCQKLQKWRILMNAVLCYLALSCQVGFLKHCFPYSISLIHCFWYYVYGFLHLEIKKFQTKCFGDPGIIREFERSFCGNAEIQFLNAVGWSTKSGDWRFLSILWWYLPKCSLHLDSQFILTEGEVSFIFLIVG